MPASRLTNAGVFGLYALMMVLIVTGCSHSPKKGTPGSGFATVPVPQPPVFLVGPMALLLTNVDGFRAHVVLEEGTPPKPTATGELMGWGGSLVFAPALPSTGGKRSPTAGFAFIWDVSASRGYMLNDPLQAYAPISSNLQFTNLTVNTTVGQGAPETIAGHSCQPAQAVVATSDGSLTTLRFWRAADLKGLPLRIVGASAGRPSTLTFSKARLEPEPSDLFLPPSGFTKYESPEALINELAARQHALKRRPGYQLAEPETFGAPDVHSPSRP